MLTRKAPGQILIPSIATLIRNIFSISTQIPRIPKLILCTRIPIPFLVLPPLFPHFSHFVLQFLILTFKDSLLSCILQEFVLGK